MHFITRPLPLPFARALRADTRTLTAARARAVRVQPCHRILEATTMRRTAGVENKIGTRVERREKPPNSLPPLQALDYSHMHPASISLARAPQLSIPLFLSLARTQLHPIRPRTHAHRFRQVLFQGLYLHAPSSQLQRPGLQPPPHGPRAVHSTFIGGQMLLWLYAHGSWLYGRYIPSCDD
jgi:hypothetical protein